MGSRSLIWDILSGIFISICGITGTIGKGLAIISNDKEYIN